MGPHHNQPTRRSAATRLANCLISCEFNEPSCLSSKSRTLQGLDHPMARSISNEGRRDKEAINF